VRSEKRRRGILSRIEKLERQRDEYQRHIEAGTIPTVVFGGRRNFRLLREGKLSREKWRELRSNAFYSRGQANQHGPNGQYGNANTELRYQEGNLFDLAVRIPSGQGRGKDRWLGLTVYVPHHNVSLLADWLALCPGRATGLATGQAYSVEVRRHDGRIFCHITLDLPAVENGNTQNGIAGIDVNPKGVAVTIVHPDGNYQVSRSFPCPELVDVSANKRDWLIGNLVRDAIRWAKSYGVEVVTVERLKFGQTHDTDRRFNRMTHAFAHRKLLETVYTRCWKEGLATRLVNPAFSSIIGRVKYGETYGLSDHQAAAMVIARRGLGFEERIPLALTRAVFGTEDKLSSWKAWGEVARWLASVRRHATRNGLNPNAWSLSDYLRYPVRPR
jgi:IS605 OrfB family transposase